MSCVTCSKLHYFIVVREISVLQMRLLRVLDFHEFDAHTLLVIQDVHKLIDIAL